MTTIWFRTEEEGKVFGYRLCEGKGGFEAHVQEVHGEGEEARIRKERVEKDRRVSIIDWQEDPECHILIYKIHFDAAIPLEEAMAYAEGAAEDAS